MVNKYKYHRCKDYPTGTRCMGTHCLICHFTGRKLSLYGDKLRAMNK